MTVATINLPNFTIQDAATYKASIDATIAAHNGVAGAFAPSALANPGMGIMVQSAVLPGGTVIPAQSIEGIGAPTAATRIDRVFFDMTTRRLGRMLGTESATPVAPSLPYTAYPIAQIELSPGDTAILNSAIVDDRPLTQQGACYYDGAGYTVVTGPDGMGRVYIGNVASNPKTILVMHADGLVEFQNAKGATVATLDSVGNLSIAGKVTENATF